MSIFYETYKYSRGGSNHLFFLYFLIKPLQFEKAEHRWYREGQHNFKKNVKIFSLKTNVLLIFLYLNGGHGGHGSGPPS